MILFLKKGEFKIKVWVGNTIVGINAVNNNKSKLSFPDSFEKGNHPVIQGASQWLLKENNETIISIVGGGSGPYGDGITTFEMWDFREDEPRGYLTKDEINNHLNNLQ